jgi:hypothetical protein
VPIRDDDGEVRLGRPEAGEHVAEARGLGAGMPA